MKPALSFSMVGALLVTLAAFGCGGDAVPASDVSPAIEPPRTDTLANAHDSIYALAAAILEGIRTGDVENLLRLRLDAGEFRHIVWETLPASRPERNLTWDYVWSDLDQKSRNAMRMTIDRHRGRSYRLLRVEFAGEVTDHGAYKVHRDARCVVEDESGAITEIDLFGSVIEMGGRYKAFSYVVD